MSLGKYHQLHLFIKWQPITPTGYILYRIHCTFGLEEKFSLTDLCHIQEDLNTFLKGLNVQYDSLINQPALNQNAPLNSDQRFKKIK